MTPFSSEALESRRQFSATVGLDPTFGTVVTHVSAKMDVAMHGVALSHGRFLAYGLSVDNTTGGERGVFALYDAHGQLVKTFGKKGLLIQDPATFSKFDFVNNLIALPDGTVLVDAGSGEHKLNLNGAFDGHFGNGGVLPKHAYAPTLLPDGAIQAMQTATDPVSKNIKSRLLTFDLNGKYLAETAFVAGTPYRLGNGQFAQTRKNDVTLYNGDLTPSTAFGTQNGTVGLTTALTNWVSKHGPWYQNLTKLTTSPRFGVGGLSPAADGGYVVGFSVDAQRTPAKASRSSENLYIKLDVSGGIVSVGLKFPQLRLAGVYFRPPQTTATYGSFSFGQGDAVTVAAAGTNHGYMTNAVPAGDGSYYLVGQSDGDVRRGWGFAIVHTRPLVGAITGTVFGDANANRTPDANETPGVGKVVYLDANNNSRLDAGEITTLTNAQGCYAFPDLGPGTYTVRRIVPAGFVLTTPVQTITLQPGQRANVYICTKAVHSAFA